MISIRNVIASILLAWQCQIFFVPLTPSKALYKGFACQERTLYTTDAVIVGEVETASYYGAPIDLTEYLAVVPVLLPRVVVYVLLSASFVRTLQRTGIFSGARLKSTKQVVEDMTIGNLKCASTKK